MPLQIPDRYFVEYLNSIIKQRANLRSLYDFGGGNYIVPAPSGIIRINGEDKHNVYILAFDKDETNAGTDTNTRS